MSQTVVSPTLCELEASWVRGKTRITTASSASPVCLVQPRAEGPAAWVYQSTLGPGMMEGDSHLYSVQVKEGARLFLAPQSNTRILPCDGGGKVELNVSGTVYANACCVVAGDPTVLYKGSRFSVQNQWTLHPSARFLVMDAWTAGRMGRGERFEFESLETDMRIEHLSGKPLHVDRFTCGKNNGFAAFGDRGCQLNLWAHGPEIPELEVYLRAWLKETSQGRPRWNGEGLIAGIGYRPGRGLGLKALSQTRQDLDELIRAVFSWTAHPNWLGGNPWLRKF